MASVVADPTAVRIRLALDALGQLVVAGAKPGQKYEDTLTAAGVSKADMAAAGAVALMIGRAADEAAKSKDGSGLQEVVIIAFCAGIKLAKEGLV